MVLLTCWVAAWVYLGQHLDTVHSLLNSISPLELSRGQMIRRIHSSLGSQEGIVTIASSRFTRRDLNEHRQALLNEQRLAVSATDSLADISDKMFDVFERSYQHALTRWLYQLHENREDFQSRNRIVHEIEDSLLASMRNDLDDIERTVALYFDELSRGTPAMRPSVITRRLDDIRLKLREYETLTGDHTLDRVAMVGKMSQALTLLNYLILGIMAVIVTVVAYDAWRLWVGFRQLHRGTLSVAKGLFESKVQIRNFKELEELGDAFNDMAGQLHELQKMRSDFFSKLVHDFKSPLDNIKQSADYLMNVGAETPGEEQKKFLDIIRRSATNLRQMVQDQLDESRLIAGQSNLQYEWANLRTLVRERMELQRPVASGKKVDFAIRYTNAPYELHLDRLKIVRVIDNLLSNAVKFSSPGSTVSVELEDLSYVIQVRVKDDGPGIAPSDQDKVFRKYAHFGVMDNAGGSGIGLYTCKYIVELHGGQIWFHTKEGKGTTFYFTLPKHAPTDSITSPPLTSTSLPDEGLSSEAG
jgi:signal transduction histidine kinase